MARFNPPPAALPVQKAVPLPRAVAVKGPPASLRGLRPPRPHANDCRTCGPEKLFFHAGIRIDRAAYLEAVKIMTDAVGCNRYMVLYLQPGLVLLLRPYGSASKGRPRKIKSAFQSAMFRSAICGSRISAAHNRYGNCFFHCFGQIGPPAFRI
jgi:hypothetical protein